MKYYFGPEEAESCFSVEYWEDYMNEHGLNEITLFRAIRETGTGYFYCKHYQEIGEVGEGCGKMCKAYSPRNKKNGRCRHSGYLYDYGKKIILTKTK